MAALATEQIEDYLFTAMNTATRSSIRTHKTGALLVPKNGHMVRGWSHESQLRLKRYRSIHAEMHAIIRSTPTFVSDATMFVATLSRAGNVTLAKPCHLCQTYMKDAGIKTVFFTLAPGNGGLFGVMHL